MATRVDEVMNRELFSVRPGESAADVRGYLMALGITGAPVIDGEGRPVGVVALRDLVETRPEDTAQRRMSRPAIAVPVGTPIQEAARLLAEANVHRLIVVDPSGHAVGMLSALDVIRGLIGLPASHPATFPHFDADNQLVWTDDRPLDGDRVEAAPVGAGVLVLSTGAAGMPDQVFWAESARDLRYRLLEILSLPHSQLPQLRRGLERGNVRFRAAAVEDLEQAQRIANRILATSVRPAPARAAG